MLHSAAGAVGCWLCLPSKYMMMMMMMMPSSNDAANTDLAGECLPFHYAVLVLKWRFLRPICASPTAANDEALRRTGNDCGLAE